MNYGIDFIDHAKNGMAELKKSNKPSYNKLLKLLAELTECPRTGTGKPEQLKYKAGGWSRRIDRKNRLIYTIDDDSASVTIESVLGHYNDR